MVRGSGQKHYDVFIDLEHPRKSKCNCPHADGKRVICKHMISLYFAAYPKIAQKYCDEAFSINENKPAHCNLIFKIIRAEVDEENDVE